MEYTEIMKDFFDIGFKQGAFEKLARFTNGKTSEIFRGRTAITKELIQQTLEGLIIIQEKIAEIITQLEELQLNDNPQTYIVYELTFPDGKKYYGRTYNLDARWQNGYGYKTQKVGKAIQQYGWENVQKRIIAENLTKKNAEMIEHSLIKGTGSDVELLGYNEY